MNVSRERRIGRGGELRIVDEEDSWMSLEAFRHDQ